MSLQFYEGQAFWKSPSEYQPGTMLTDEKISEVERHLHVRLPRGYIELMKQQNGGELAFRYVLFEDGDAAIIPYLYEVEIDHGIGLSSVFIDECRLPDKLVLLTGDLHSWLALDYREKSNPSVVYITESETESGKWDEHPLADSFDQFTTKLFCK
ncbi:SMI1/KNR4 family protein [Halalkalibacter krulwichiae]|uniref:SMI1 / KNR4 family protein n=1 Tax=Halalkalibacter krulwichiae TaxID=199441 RepID=A0A1X9M9W6_9BACI|nr:SMI1/KNR4 family protein [Halalkalibacter krulwichiae]ARK30215.1 SMI1 / KNR4 family protein [Halalkalibacter krulwichiae]